MANQSKIFQNLISGAAILGLISYLIKKKNENKDEKKEVDEKSFIPTFMRLLKEHKNFFMKMLLFFTSSYIISSTL